MHIHKYPDSEIKFCDDGLIVKNDKFIASVKQPISEWKCYLFGSFDDSGIVFHPTNGKHPNFFWRFMQYICFGNKWVHTKK